jgi:hypothetical protein
MDEIEASPKSPPKGGDLKKFRIIVLIYAVLTARNELNMNNPQ